MVEHDMDWPPSRHCRFNVLGKSLVWVLAGDASLIWSTVFLDTCYGTLYSKP